MKLLHVSDLHFRAHWFEWVAKQSRDYDAVCLAGDLLDMFGTHRASLREQSKWVRDWLRDFPGRLFVCSGNHDWWDSDGVVDTDACCGWLDKMARPEVTIDGQGADCGGYHIFCHPFRFPGIWPHAPHGKWILLHHLPPALAATGVSGSGGTDNGCRGLAGALTAGPRPPRIVLSGHLHKPKSWRGLCGQTWSFNPTFDESATVPNHIILDLKGWHGDLGDGTGRALAGSRAVSLGVLQRTLHRIVFAAGAGRGAPRSQRAAMRLSSSYRARTRAEAASLRMGL